MNIQQIDVKYSCVVYECTMYCVHCTGVLCTDVQCRCVYCTCMQCAGVGVWCPVYWCTSFCLCIKYKPHEMETLPKFCCCRGSQDFPYDTTTCTYTVLRQRDSVVLASLRTFLQAEEYFMSTLCGHVVVNWISSLRNVEFEKSQLCHYLWLITVYRQVSDFCKQVSTFASDNNLCLAFYKWIFYYCSLQWAQIILLNGAHHLWWHMYNAPQYVILNVRFDDRTL